MRYKIIDALVLLSALLPSVITAQQDDFPVLKGPYLGQTPPVDKPLLFAPGIVSTDAGNHSSPAFTSGGNEIYWSMSEKIWVTRLQNEIWTEPEIVPFCKDDSYAYDNPFITTDGKMMFFTSFRPSPNSLDKENIWFAERTLTGWSDPKEIGLKVNEVPLHWSISVSDSGTLYFQYQNKSGEPHGGIGDIYYSEVVNGEYSRPVSIGSMINTPATETCPHIAPDESYILFTRFDQANFKNTGIFISYRDKAGSWLPPLLVAGGDKKSGGLSPRISPDSEYLFYVNGGTFWRSAAFIEELRPK